MLTGRGGTKPESDSSWSRQRTRAGDPASGTVWVVASNRRSPTQNRSTRYRCFPQPRVGLLVLAFGLVGAGCAPEPQTEYSQETEDNFFAACTDPLSDALLHTRLCQCVYQRVRIQVPYGRLAVLDEEMVADPELKLEGELVEIIAECVIEEGDLGR